MVTLALFLTSEDDFGLLGKVFGRALGHADDTHTHFAKTCVNLCSFLTIIWFKITPTPLRRPNDEGALKSFSRA